MNKIKLINISLEWRRFLSGQWQKEIPKRPGSYPIADRSGNFAGYNVIYLYKGIVDSTKAWDGWWWSEAQPELIKAPIWTKDE